jgi:hypothetical protein
MPRVILSRNWSKAKPHSVSQRLKEKGSQSMRIGKTKIKGFKAVARGKRRAPTSATC